MAIVKVLCGHCGMEFSFDTMHETLLNDEPTTIYCPFCIKVVGKVNFEPKFTPSMNESLDFFRDHDGEKKVDIAKYKQNNLEPILTKLKELEESLSAIFG